MTEDNKKNAEYLAGFSIKAKTTALRWFSAGAATQIRTGDLILTKDVLYQLSHSSNGYIIAKTFPFVKNFFEFLQQKNLLAFFHKKHPYFSNLPIYFYKLMCYNKTKEMISPLPILVKRW